MTTEPADEGNIFVGLISCWACNAAEIAAGFALLSARPKLISFSAVLILGVGLVQLVYVAPLYYFKRKRGHSETAKGVIIAASITALLSAACWGFVLTLSP